MDNRFDLQYYANVTMGGQLLQAVLDTGSIELVVLSERCGFFCGDSSDLYNPGKSKNYTKGRYALILSYGSGQLLGREAYDTFKIGPFTGKTTPFWEVLDAFMPLLFNSEFEAIAGLGPIPKGVVNLKPGAETNYKGYALMLESLGLNESRYSICLEQTPKSPGWIVWNDNQQRKTPGMFTQLDVRDSGYWMVKLTDMRLGEKKIACTHGCGAILDSGTSLIAVSDKVKRTMVQAVGVQAKNCAKMHAQLPNLNFKLNGVEYSLPPDAYTGKIRHAHPPKKKLVDLHANSTPAEAETAECAVALMQVEMTSSFGPTFILGMPFFRTYYTTFAQRTSRSPPRIFTALAGINCHAKSQDGIDDSGEELRSAKRGVVARIIDESKITMPRWLHKANLTGRLDETPQSQLGSDRFAEISPHGALSGLDQVTSTSMA